MRILEKKAHRILVLALTVYLAFLFLFTWYPRPLLESSDPNALSEFLKSHANLFYKILYADTSIVYIGNYVLLMPLALLLSWSYPHWSIGRRIGIGVGLSALIEVVQLAIPGRVSDIVDFASNSLGVVFGVGIIEIFRRGKGTHAQSE